MKTPEEQIKEVMEMTDDMLVEIHKGLIEKVGEESANNWVEMFKKFREKEIENFNKSRFACRILAVLEVEPND